MLAQPHRSWGWLLVHCTPERGPQNAFDPAPPRPPRRSGQAEPVTNHPCPKDVPGPLTTCSFLKCPSGGCSVPCSAPGSSTAPQAAGKRRAGCDSAESVFRKRGRKKNAGEIKHSPKATWHHGESGERAWAEAQRDHGSWAEHGPAALPSAPSSSSHMPCFQPRHTALPAPAPAASPGGDSDPAVSPGPAPLGSAIPRGMQFFLHSEEANEDRS